MSPRILLVGARSHRQGTGPFVAAGLAAAGAEVAAIVGTSEATVAEAQQALQRDWQLQPRGYVDLATALASERPDAVAICSPWRFHREQLQQVAEAGCHCLAEKPLAWPTGENEMDTLLGQFAARGLLLQMVTQWPMTLAAFAQLHGALPERVDSFSMRLSPISIGPDMVTDSAPHFISLLQALLGNGDFSECRLRETPAANSSALELQACYQHAAGTTSSRLLLETCEARPRPAWYSVNELRADRAVEMPDYQQLLVAGERRQAFADPMHQVAARFVEGLQQGATTDVAQLRSAHRNLIQLSTVWD